MILRKSALKLATVATHILPKKVKDFLLKVEYRNISYSQEGEDLILARIFGEKKNGRFVDVGAHHPKKYSNTYKFYLSGWRGINIDAMPGSMISFQKYRPEDINIEAGVACNKGELTYYIFNEPALNTFDKVEAGKKDGKNGYTILRKIKVNVLPLAEILDQYLAPTDPIDFLTIDVEGLDFEVIQSNNWNVYRPKVVLIEELRNIQGENNNKISAFLVEKGYELIAKTYNTLIFKDTSYNLN
ncbi:MAG: FkbM family methyltransferase [Flavobacterium sp.]|nr:MAG: FkbM family methyltransferase [Flavobacterium sp.]